MSETIAKKSSGGAGGPPPLPALPGWRVERLIGALGKGPAKVGGWLDGWAKSAVFPINIIVRMLSSVWMGILWLFLTSVYIAIGSGFASVRARLEITELQFFDGWPMVGLMVLLTLTLAVVTVRRIPLTVFKLGVWIVHVGIITLVAGCFWYFSQKREGQACVHLHQTTDYVYDTNTRALYLRRMGGANSAPGPTVMAVLPTLPIYHEHLSRDAYLAGGMEDSPGDNPVDIALDQKVLSQQDAQLAGLTVRVVGYYPYVDFSGQWMAGAEARAGEEAPNPAVRVSLRVADKASGAEGGVAVANRWLIGKRPAERVADADDAPFGMEYLYHPTDAQVRDATVSFHGPMAITVRVPKLHVEHTYAVETGKAIAIEGTPYTVTPGETSVMPMLSKGYEGAWSSALMLDVVRKESTGGEFKFQRQALFRYPERSPDFLTVDGKMKRVQGRVDNDIEIIFHDATRHQFWVIEGAEGAGTHITLAHRDTAGKCETMPMALGKSNDVKVGGITLGVGLEERTSNATETPRIVPVRSREGSMNAAEAITNSAVELELSAGSWTRRHVYVPFIEFARWRDVPEGTVPAEVDVPGVGRVEILLSTVRRQLPVELTLVDFRAVKRPGAVHTFNDFVSTVEMKDKRTGTVQRRVISLNNPVTDQGLTFFQAKWDGHEEVAEGQRFSVLGVGNRPGIYVMAAGAALMVAGVLYAFYVRPVLLRKKKAALQAYAKKSMEIQG